MTTENKTKDWALVWSKRFWSILIVNRLWSGLVTLASSLMPFLIAFLSEFQYRTYWLMFSLEITPSTTGYLERGFNRPFLVLSFRLSLHIRYFEFPFKSKVGGWMMYDLPFLFDFGVEKVQRLVVGKKKSRIFSMWLLVWVHKRFILARFLRGGDTNAEWTSLGTFIFEQLFHFGSVSLDRKMVSFVGSPVATWYVCNITALFKRT